MIRPHGGKLVNRYIDKSKLKHLKDGDMQRLRVIDDIILDIEKIAVGAYSPIKGFMDRDDFKSVVHDKKLSNGIPWTIPIFLPVDDKFARSLSKGEHIIIQDQNRHDVALLKISDIYSFPKGKWADKVYGTQSRNHPGVNRLFDMHDKLIGGNIWLMKRPKFKFEKYNLDPTETRELIKKRNWKTVAGFQTRNIPHRAHEYLQKKALTFTDGLLIHPIIGWKKQGDFNPGVIIKAYDILIRDYYPKGAVLFSGLATAMRYAGPREAVFHAIIRKNYGCTHFIVGRDHAGVGGFYDKYEAHRIFDDIRGLGIQIMALRGPYYCKRCAEVTTDKICPHKDKDH
ncbi:sulfate adenylyltransferase, partial [Candidatus Omnitrophota bacterium]